MNQKATENIKKDIGKKNIKTYLFFVLFTTFLWLALQFSKNYSQEVTFGVDYINVEKEKMVLPKTDHEIKMVLEGNGFQLLKYSLFKKTIELDINSASSVSKKQAYFTGKSMLSIIKSSLDYDGEIAYALKDSLRIYFDVLEKKKIPLKIDANVTYKNGYNSVKGVTSKISIVHAIGPKSVVDTLKFVFTKQLVLKNVDEDYNGNLSLKSYGNGLNIRFEEKSIPVNLIVDKLTESEFKVPITIKNIPKGSRIQLFPKEVPVVFSASLKDYKKLSPKNFIVSGDIKNATDQSTLVLKLEEVPESVYNARLLQKNVQYIIVN